MAVVTLADVKTYIGIRADDATFDTQLQWYIDAAEEFIAYVAGPIEQQQFTELYNVVGKDTITLRNPPVISIQSVTEYVGNVAYTLTEQPPGQSRDMWGYTLDQPVEGVLRRRSAMGTPMNFLGPIVVVTYTAGRTTVPGDLKLAVLEDIRGLFQAIQLSGRPAFGQDSGDFAEQWQAGPVRMFPRLAALLTGPSRTPSIA